MRPDDTAPDDAVLIPLRYRDGSVRAYALVDTADADFVNQWRWHLNSEGYAMRNEGRQRIRLHRALLGLTPSDETTGDHINRNRLDDRRENLRRIPKAGNRQNRSSNAMSSSKYRGVSWDARCKKWVAQVKSGRKNYYLGLFENEIDAADAARAARQRILEYATD